MQQHIAFQRTDFETIFWRSMVDQVIQELISPGFVVPIELTVRGDKNQLSLASIEFVLHETLGQIACREKIGVTGCVPIERDASGKRRVIEETRDTATVAQPHQVRFRRINRPDCLPGSQYSIGDTMLCQQIQSFKVE